MAEAQRLSFTGSFTWRIETDEVTWSDQTYRIFGVDRGTHITLAMIGSRIHPKTERQSRSDWNALVWTEAIWRRTPACCCRSAGSDTFTSLLAVDATSGGRWINTGAVQDVTAQRVSDEALDRVRSELAHVARVTSLGALTASIAHEVNQPLLGIVTNASTCLRMLGSGTTECHRCVRNRAPHDPRWQQGVGSHCAITRPVR